MVWFHPKTFLDKSYKIGIIAKGVDGLLELVGGLLVLFIRPDTINRLVGTLTQHELSQDPHDFVATHILAYGHSLAKGSTAFAAAYLLSHGLVKIVIVVNLLRNKLWAYPFGIITLLLFIAYQLYRIAVKPTAGMILLTIFDAVVIWLIYREWQKQKLV